MGMTKLPKIPVHKVATSPSTPTVETAVASDKKIELPTKFVEQYKDYGREVFY